MLHSEMVTKSGTCNKLFKSLIQSEKTKNERENQRGKENVQITDWK
jgi:uncharacterized membrane-anchored protein